MEPAETLQQVFARYDLNGDSVLDRAEVAAMIEQLGYDVDGSYVGGVMGMFGRFDANADGVIEIEEFPSLWEQFGGPPLAPPAAPPAEAASHVPAVLGGVVETEHFREPSAFCEPGVTSTDVGAVKEHPSGGAASLQQDDLGHRSEPLFQKPSAKEQRAARDTLHIRNPAARKSLDQLQAQLRSASAASAVYEAEQILQDSQRALPDTDTKYVPGSLTSVQRFPRQVEVAFNDPTCQIGIQLSFIRSGRQVKLKVAGITPKSLAARAPDDIQVGMSVVRINGTPAEKLLGNRNIIRNMLMVRPVTVVFSSESGAEALAEHPWMRETVGGQSVRTEHAVVRLSPSEEKDRRHKSVATARQKLERAVSLGIFPADRYDALKDDEQFLLRYNQIIRAKPIEATFVERGNLGIVFCAAAGPTGPMAIKHIEPGPSATAASVTHLAHIAHNTHNTCCMASIDRHHLHHQQLLRKRFLKTIPEIVFRRWSWWQNIFL